MSDEAAILLAAGKGERLRPITSTRPKPSIPIGPEPIVCKHLKALSKKVSLITVVASYMKDVINRIVRECAEKYKLEITLEVVDQGQELGTGHAVLVGAHKVMDKINPHSIIVAYSDTYLPIEKYYQFLEGDYEILLSPVESPWEYGVVKIENNLVKNIIEKPPKGKEPSNLVFSGLLRISADDVNILEKLGLSPRGEYELTDLITRVGMERGLKPLILKTNEWMDIGRPWDLLEANNRAILECIQNNCQETREFQVRESDNGKPFIIHERAVIEKNSTIYGPAIVGDTARLKPYAFIRDYTTLHEGSVAGAHTEIKNSILLEHAKVPHQSYVGDSIIGEHVNLGASTQTANLRFDDKPVKMTIKGKRVSTGRRKMGAVIGGYAKTGIGVLIYPGVKIGSYSIIYPGCRVARDVPDNSIVKCDG